MRAAPHQLAEAIEELLLRSTGTTTTLVEQLRALGLQAEVHEAKGIRQQLVAIRDRTHSLRRRLELVTAGGGTTYRRADS